MADDRAPGRDRRRLAIAVAAGVVVVAGVAVVAFAMRDDLSSSSGSTATSSAATAGPSTRLDPFSVKPECSTPTSSDWKELGWRGTGELGAPVSTGDVTVVSGRYRPADGGSADVRVRLDFQNHANGSRRQYWWFYELSVAGEAVAPHCLSVVGGNEPAGPEETTQLLLGFHTSADPTSGGALLIAAVGHRGRVELDAT